MATAKINKSPEQKREEASARMAAARAVRLAKLQGRQQEIVRAQDSGTGMASMTHHEPILSESDWAQDMGDAPMMAGDAQHVVIFSTEDGTASRCRIEQLVNKLMPDKDGHVYFSEKPINPAWKYTMDPITNVPTRIHDGAVKCMLHAESPDREWCNSIGLEGLVCPAGNIPSRYQLNMHMRRKHPTAWMTIEEERTRRREDEDRARQDKILELAARR